MFRLYLDRKTCELKEKAKKLSLDNKMQPQKHQYNWIFYVATFATVAFIYGLLQYIISERYKDFETQQVMYAQHNVLSASESITNYIINRRKLLSLLTVAHNDELQQLTKTPNDTRLYEDLLKKFRVLFPEIISISLTSPKGETLTSITTDFTLGKGCQNTIQLFSQGHLEHIFLHSNPKPEHYHFDILTHYDTPSRHNNIIFVSIKTNNLQHILNTQSQDAFQLYLVKDDKPDIIEISKMGNRGILDATNVATTLPNSEYLASKNVIATKWTLIASKSTQAYQQFAAELKFQRNAVMTLVLFASLLVCFIFYKNDKKRLQAELNTYNQNKNLEKTVLERTQELSFQATHDSLTNLINRREFERRIQNAIQLAQSDHAEFILMYLDLDQFKIINDTAGHAAGDQLLKEVSSLLKSQLRKGDTLARLGGDEFGILLNHCSLTRAEMIAEQLCSIIYNYTFEWEKHSFTFGVSIGIIEINNGAHDLAELLSYVDSACYIAKSQGRNRYYVYDPDDTVFQQHQQTMSHAEIALTAIKNKQFELHGQRINAISAAPQALEWYEVLIRIKPENELIFPDTFIPALEQSGNIYTLDNVVMNKAISYLALYPNTKLSINLSPLTLLNPSFIKSVKQAFNQCEANPSHLCFEITETAAVQNLNPVQQFISKVHKLGCSVALDDFGSGMSSFSYLKNLNVDYIKLDGSFVKDMHQEPIHSAMVDAMNTIAKAMNKFVIAEYVENQEIADILSQFGVAYGQGYHLHKPEKLDDILST